MSVTTLDANKLAVMFIAGAKNLEAKKEWINELNVFPVPDGDTGTNMTLTIMSAADEVSALYSTDDITIETLSKAISSGSLRGARGNSGVILSQLFRGFTKVIKKLETDNITPEDFAEGCNKAVETAYKAVMKPKEGTILTVAKAVADKVAELVDGGETDYEVIFKNAIEYGDEILLKTPDMLPVLKQAGVVDSGGQGLMEVFHGGFDAFMGKEVDLSSPKAAESKPAAQKENPVQIKFGYCTEFIIKLNKNFNIGTENDFKAYLESIGDSIVVVTDEDIVKVHVHTNDPGLALQKALKFGQLDRIKIDNMRLENQEIVAKNHENFEEKIATKEIEEDVDLGPRKDVGFIAVSVGSGINEIFTSLGVDAIIEGGQTMNPSTEDMLNAIDKVNADHIFILPNNKNIIMAAQQAASICEDKDIIVIPTKTVPQGITAMINFVPDMSAQENTAAMTEQIGLVKTGQVTYAVRDTMIDDKEIKQGDFMGIGDSGILSVGQDKEQVTIDMISEMIDEDSELISIYYGEEITEETASELCDKITEKFDSLDVEVQSGGQPIYSYIVSIE